MVWQTVAKHQRELLNVEADFRPFSSRPEVQLRGIARQLSVPNFVFELLDIRMMWDNKRHGVELTEGPRKGLLVDITQDTRYQLAGGAVSLLAGSRVFIYELDRCGCPEESLRLMGWGDDIDTNVLDTDIVPMLRAQAEGGAPKKKKGKPVLRETKIRDVAGNGECLPDLASIVVPLVYCLNCGIFKHDLKMSDIPFDEIYAGHATETGVISIPADLSQRELRAIDKAARTSTASELFGDDSGSEHGSDGGGRRGDDLSD